MGIMVHSLLWEMQDFCHQPLFSGSEGQSSRGLAFDWGFRVYTEVTAKYVLTCCVAFVGWYVLRVLVLLGLFLGGGP